MQHMADTHSTLGWGKVVDSGAEIWDAKPVFLGDSVTARDWMKLLFYPKKWMLYRWIKKSQKSKVFSQKSLGEPYRVLDVGCGTGATLIDLNRLFGRTADVVG
ncbi:MAG: hypothetical protein AAB932_05165, partial [Patescibacteria group bacterium]